MKTTSASSRNLFIPIPGDVFADFDGRLTPTAWSVLSVIYRQVDFETGLWNGSAAKVAAAWGGQLEERTIQRAIKRLHDLGYIKSFHRRGHRHNYRVAIEGYIIRFGPLAGHDLDAANTTNPDRPVYVKRGSLLSVTNSQTCRCEDEDDPQRQVTDSGSRNSSQDAGLEEIPQRHERQKDLQKTAENGLPVGDKSDDRGAVVSCIPEVPEQQQQHDDGGSKRKNPNLAYSDPPTPGYAGRSTQTCRR
jgi:hypothetical protein